MSLLVLCAGLPGVGKTTLCKMLKDRIDCAFFDSDEYAKKSPYFETVDTSELSKEELEKGRSEFYDRKIREVRKLMLENEIVIMDAVFDKKDLRDKFYKMVNQINGELLIVKITAPDKIIKRRIRNDEPKDRPGFTVESRLKLYKIIKENWEPIERNHIVVDSSNDLSEQLDEIIKIIK